MSIVLNIVVGFIALSHVGFLVLEMFLWDKPAGLKIFDNDSETGKKYAESSKILAANQGLYNGFLAAGLFWGLSLGASGTSVKVFFLCCVLIAGLYGAASNRKLTILLIQAMPAALGLALVFLS
ncbi:MAG: putative rane protein [Blastocatellia bacterium]